MIGRIRLRLVRALRRIVSRFKVQVPVYVPVFKNGLLKGRKALVTGGTGGIGYSIAKSFLESGATICITGRCEDRINAAIRSLQEMSCVEGGTQDKVYGIVMNNLEVSSFQEKVYMAQELMKGLDILVNNAGVVDGDRNEASYDLVLNTNTKAPYYLSNIIAQDWVTKGIKGNILNVCSSSSLRPGQNPYIISKWGLRSITLGLAKTYASRGIVVNGVAPGPTDTDSMKRLSGIGIDWTKNPAGRLVTRQEIANLAVILVSDLCRMVVGDILYVSGGAGVVTFDDV